MKKRKDRFRISLAALALFLVVGQPFTALAAETGQDSPGDPEPLAVIQVGLTTGPSVFGNRLEGRTDYGRPLEGTTRAQYVQILYEAIGTPAVTIEPCFSDVSITADYAAAVSWAWEFGVVSEDVTDLFRPDDRITQYEAEEMLARTFSALSGAAQQMVVSVLAAYTGRTDETNWALIPADLVSALESALSDESVTITNLTSLSACAPPPPTPMVT